MLPALKIRSYFLLKPMFILFYNGRTFEIYCYKLVYFSVCSLPHRVSAYLKGASWETFCLPTVYLNGSCEYGMCIFYKNRRMMRNVCIFFTLPRNRLCSIIADCSFSFVFYNWGFKMVSICFIYTPDICAVLMSNLVILFFSNLQTKLEAYDGAICYVMPWSRPEQMFLPYTQKIHRFTLLKSENICFICSVFFHTFCVYIIFFIRWMNVFVRKLAGSLIG